MIDWIAAILMIVGSMFSLLAAVGIVRMPDLYTRMHASTKSITFGVGFILLAVAIHFRDLGIATQALLVIAFLLLTAPISAHIIGRAAYLIGVPQWEGTLIDELTDKYPPPPAHPVASDDEA